MFANCSALETVDLSNLEVANNYSVSAQDMFYNCSSLTRLDMRKYNFTRITTSTNMFTNVPANCLIIVADTTQKDWFATKFPSLTNVKTVAEL
jgi:surface protein